MESLSAGNAGTVSLGSLIVNRIGLGTNRISDNDESRAVLKRAVELGVNFIDTAHRYGRSEEIIGQTLAPYPAGVMPSTKGGWSQDNSPETLQANIDQSLQLLKLEQLPLWHLHRVDPSVPIEETMQFLKSQQDSGKILHIGLSEVTIEQIEQARKIVPIVSVQNHYNLVTRQHEEVVNYCTKENIAFLPYFPLTGAGSPAVQVIAQKYSALPTQIAIAWLLKRSPVMLPIPGTLNTKHLESNIAAAKLELSDSDYQELLKLGSA